MLRKGNAPPQHPHSGSLPSSPAGGIINMQPGSNNKPLPPLFYYMEAGDWSRAIERAKRHPREVKSWATIRSKSEPPKVGPSDGTVAAPKRLALHHACFKLRRSVYAENSQNKTDPFIEVCKFIILLLELYPDAAGMRESRHGCLPLHLVAFASCTLPSDPADADPGKQGTLPLVVPSSSSGLDFKFSLASLAAALPGVSSVGSGGLLSRPVAVSPTKRSVSESSNATVQTTMTAGMLEETAVGKQTDYHKFSNTNQAAATIPPGHVRSGSSGSLSAEFVAAVHAADTPAIQPTMSVSIGNNILISEKREEWAVKVLNALLDAHPKGLRMDSEGGRLPLHTACAGRATPRVVSTLLTAYPAAARHRNKDGFLPLHLAAHWGISHPNVVIALLKAYPDATFGRNRWERTPLEEALCMAGENGRPHQAALVRALRKHPSYWTRPADVFQTTPARSGNQLVDIDETLPSTDESDEDAGRFGRELLSNGKNADAGMAVSKNMDLASMIRHQNWSGVIARLEINPEEAEQDLVVLTRGGFTATTGFTPLHFACERRPPVAVVEALISACPRAITARAMPGGALPLHVACTWYAPVGVINALILADRNGCKTQDELGNFPLHAACFSGTSPQVFDTLLRAYPKAVLVRNHQGSLPEEITKRLRHDERKAILVLLDVCKQQVLAKREKKHKKNRDDAGQATSGHAHVIALNPQSETGEQELVWV